MPQFFLPPEAANDERFRLDGPEAFHIVKVLRHKEGDVLPLFDGRGGRFEGVITRIGEDGSVEGRLTARASQPKAAAADVRLYLGLLKASHWELALEKGTELGASVLVPVLTPRTVVLLHEAERVHAKRLRWERIVMAAAKQCARADLPRLEDPVEFRDAIRQCQGRGLTIVAWEGLKGAPAGAALGPALRGLPPDAPRRVNVFIGPEGGFSDEEIELAESLGALVCGLGPRILRAETAALAACALVQYELGCL